VLWVRCALEKGTSMIVCNMVCNRSWIY